MKEIKYYKCTIKGTRPLIHDRYPLEEILECKKKGGKRTRGKDIEKEVEEALYKDKDGTIYQPATHIEGALFKSAGDFPWNGKKSYKHIISSVVEVLPEKIRFEVPKDPRQFEIDLQVVRSSSTGGRQIVARPKWKEWQFTFYLKVYDSIEIDGHVLEQILKNAGLMYGIGTFRRKYGKFEVTSFHEVDASTIKLE